MKWLRYLMFFLFALGTTFSQAYGAEDVAKGKAFFTDPEFAGGSTGKSCNSCHPDGKGAAKAADNKDVRKIINKCILNALHARLLVRTLMKWMIW